MALYSEKVMDHFRNPRNVGKIDDADGVGEVGNAKCGDIMKIYLKIENDIIVDVKFNTFGCGSAIASSSMATELIKGKPLSKRSNSPTRRLPKRWTACPRTSFIAPCLRKKRYARRLRTITTKTGYRTTRRSSPTRRKNTTISKKINIFRK